MKTFRRIIVMGLAASAVMLSSFQASAIKFDFEWPEFERPERPTFECPEFEWPEWEIPEWPQRGDKPDCVLTCLEDLDIDLEGINLDNWREKLEGLKDIDWEGLFACLKDCEPDRTCDVPDGGATLALMGLGLLGVAGLRKRLAQK